MLQHNHVKCGRFHSVACSAAEAGNRHTERLLYPSAHTRVNSTTVEPLYKGHTL